MHASHPPSHPCFPFPPSHATKSWGPSSCPPKKLFFLYLILLVFKEGQKNYPSPLSRFSGLGEGKQSGVCSEISSLFGQPANSRLANKLPFSHFYMLPFLLGGGGRAETLKFCPYEFLPGYGGSFLSRRRFPYILGPNFIMQQKRRKFSSEQLS